MRKYSSISVETTLASSVGATGTTMTVATGTGTGLLGGITLTAGNVDQFTLAIDPDTTNEEIVFATANSGDTFTITRGRAGSTAIAHGAGATVKHVLTSDDLSYFNNAIQSSVAAPGTPTVDGDSTTIQVKRATASSFTSTNPTLAAGQIGFETDTGKFKIGTGSSAWTGLGYAAIPASTATAKGDLLVATASSVITRQAVGTNNQVLMADSAQTNGIKYANEATATLTTTGDLLYASAANTLARIAIGTNGQILTVSNGVPTWATKLIQPILVPKVSNNLILGTKTEVTKVTDEDVTFYVPVYLPNYNYDRIICKTGGATWGTGTMSVRLGIYNADPVTFLPSTVYLDAGTVSASAANIEYSITINVTPSEGYYYLAINAQSLPTTGRLLAHGESVIPHQNYTTISTSSPIIAYTQSGVSGAFASAGTLTASTNAYAVALRIA